MRNKKVIIILAAVGIATLAYLSYRYINRKNSVGPVTQTFTVKIDWVPSAEYYGFFYALEKGFYLSKELDVKIQSGTGAPNVAKELSVGSVYAGTTTSDNLLRQLADGAQFTKAVVLLKYNPCVLAVKRDSDIQKISDVKGRTIGTNQQSSAYQQFTYILSKQGIPITGIREIPIGYGGAAQVQTGQADGILGYTTNVIVDLEYQQIPIREIYFGDNGVESYGLVLAINQNAAALNGVTPESVNRFLEATLQGYSAGENDISGAVAALIKVAPTLDRGKLELAMNKIIRLNRTTQYSLEQIDGWVTDPKVTPTIRKQMQGLLGK
jgi:ABC-type nitrate/sulfonate/bicarbonate transport system substrate-binding protein